jgi:hypothetical protein
MVARLICLIPLVLAGATAPARDGDAKSTSHPDLQGIWDLSNLTPLERLPEFNSFVISRLEVERFEASIDGRKGELREPPGFEEIRRVEPIRGEWRSSVVVDPPNGLIPGNALFKEKASQARTQFVTGADGPEQRPTQERCLLSSTGAAPMYPTVSGNLHQIVQTPNVVVIYSELIHDARIIRMNAQHVPAAVTSLLGDSIGRWEGDTLVVETKYFNAGNTRIGPFVLFFVAPQTVVTERFALESKDVLHYSFTVEDATYYTRPWSGETAFLRSSAAMFEYACHEGNYALSNVLSGARVQQR